MVEDAKKDAKKDAEKAVDHQNVCVASINADKVKKPRREVKK